MTIIDNNPDILRQIVRIICVAVIIINILLIALKKKREKELIDIKGNIVNQKKKREQSY